MPESRQRVNMNGFVLAGGLSSRMGRDKCLLDWHGRTLLSHMVHLLSTAADPVRIIGREEFPDTVAGRGPLSGIATALRLSGSPMALVVAVDLPLLTTEFLKDFRIRAGRSECPVVACKIGFHFPLCLGISCSTLPDIERRLEAGQRSIHGWIEDSKAEIITRRPSAMFHNINTKADYRRALK